MERVEFLISASYKIGHYASIRKVSTWLAKLIILLAVNPCPKNVLWWDHWDGASLFLDLACVPLYTLSFALCDIKEASVALYLVLVAENCWLEVYALYLPW